MKKIILYSPYLHNFGGGEKYFATLACLLSEKTDVTILSTSKLVTKNKLSDFFNLDLSKINFVSLNGEKMISENTKNCDLFICLSNFKYVKSFSKHRIQLLQIPYGKIQTNTIIRKYFSFKIKEGLKDYYRLNLLNACKNDDLVITNSNFVHDVLKSNYNLDSKVLHPPIDDFYDETIKKENIIISVGRIFSGLYNDKRYDIMIEAFRKLCNSFPNNWEYHIIGTLTSDKKSQNYYDLLKDLAKNLPIYFHSNEPYQELKKWYNKASIFWHAAGFEIDEQTEPEKVEHFGMTTVEAMSARCIPIVINRGGQKEIISNGVNGFLWNTIEEFISQTLQIIKIKMNTTYIKNNTRKRYRTFSKESFLHKSQELFSGFLD